MNKALQNILRLVQDVRAQIDARFGHEFVLTDRVKIGLVGGAGLLVLALWLGMSSWVGSVERWYHDTQFNLSRLKVQVESGAWSERKNQSHILKSVLEDRLWTAETPGLAEAGFERWIRDHLSRSKLDPQQVQVRRVPMVQPSEASADDPLAGLQRMTAKFVMPFDEAAVVRLLGDIAQNNKVITVDRLVIRAGRNARTEIDISTYYRFRERSR